MEGKRKIAVWVLKGKESLDHAVRILIAFTCCIYACAESSEAVGQDMTFHGLTVEDGLSQNSVLSVAQDRQGFMWIGTAAGLNRYDARNFKVYRSASTPSTGLMNDYILTLLADKKDRLWVGTEGGLFLYDRKLDMFAPALEPPEKSNNASNFRIRAIYEDGRGRIWAGSQVGLYIIVDTVKLSKPLYFPLENNIKELEIKSIKEDKLGNLWVSGNENIYRIGLQFGRRSVEKFNIEQPGKSEQDLSCTSIEEDSDGRLWFGTANAGLFGYNETDRSFFRTAAADDPTIRLPHDYIRKLKVDKTGRLWIGTQEGLCVWNPGSEKLKTFRHIPGDRNSLTQNSIYDICFDRAGNLWTGTYYGGVNISYSRNTPFKTIQAGDGGKGLSNNVISSLISNPKGGLWIATDGGGLNYRDAATEVFKNYFFNVNDDRSIGSNLVKTIYRDSKGRLWIGTHAGGLNLLDSANGRFTRIRKARRGNGICSNDIVQIREDRFGKFWIGSEHDGLNLYDEINQTYQHFHPDSSGDRQLDGHDIRALWIDRMDNVWVGTERGLQVKTHGSRRFLQTASIFPGLSDMPRNISINTIYEDERSDLWVGSAGQGLFRILPGENKVIQYTGKNGLPSDDIKAIITDLKGRIWLTTNKGLCGFDPERNEFRSYNVHDGLPGNDFTANALHMTADGMILAGGLNGIVYFNPTEIQRNDLPSAIAFCALRIGDKTISPNDASGIIRQDIDLIDELIINYDQNDFSIDFQLLNFIKPWKNRYAYLLDGYETEWHESHTGTATYANLPAGSYTLRIRAANNDGVWEPAERTLAIRIRPAPWATWWAWLMYFVAAGLLVYFIIRYAVMRHRFLQEQQLQQYKLDFFTNISHEIRTRLTLITTPVERLNEADLQSEQQRTIWASVRHHTIKLTELVQELLDFRKAESGNLRLKCEPTDLVDTCQGIAESFRPMAEAKGLTMECPTSKDVVMVSIDRAQFAKVVSNLLANAIKFTPTGGKIGIRIERSRQTAVLKVWDTGIGITPMNINRIFNNYFQVTDHGTENTGYGIGLALARRIVELHKGDITVQSDRAGDRSNIKNSFTEFTVSIPALNHGDVAENTDVPPEKLPFFPAGGQEQTMVTEKPLILVVEDNAELRQMLEESLTPMFEVLAAEDGKQGLEIAGNRIPDLVVSDIMMPLVDGLQLCDRLKSDRETSHIPVILLTAKATLDDRITGLEHRADAYISKPFSLKLLITQINNLIENRRQLQDVFREAMMVAEKSPATVPVRDEFLLELEGYILKNLENAEFNVALLAKHAAMSQPILYRKIKALTGLSVNDFIKSIRLRRAAELLGNPERTVYEVAYMVGFSDRKYFSREFKKVYEMTPSAYAQEQGGAKINETETD
jgi:ligand-binding sensor domain-containing protein/signal transduction histidine kinase/DNA-binding response OmpR family regulator